MKGKKRAGGGGIMKISGNPNVFKEAAERNKGGRVKRAAGGSVAGVGKDVGFMSGGAVRPRLDRPGRKSGGRVGANKAPLSTAHGTTSAESTPRTQEGGAS
jgi:hypothetical protein